MLPRQLAIESELDSFVPARLSVSSRDASTAKPVDPQLQEYRKSLALNSIKEAVVSHPKTFAPDPVPELEKLAVLFERQFSQVPDAIKARPTEKQVSEVTVPEQVPVDARSDGGKRNNSVPYLRPGRSLVQRKTNESQVELKKVSFDDGAGLEVEQPPKRSSNFGGNRPDKKQASFSQPKRNDQ